MLDVKTSKIYYVVENLDSVWFYLILEYADANPAFTRVADDISKYCSKELADAVIDRLKIKGFTMELKVRQMEITHKIF